MISTWSATLAGSFSHTPGEAMPIEKTTNKAALSVLRKGKLKYYQVRPGLSFQAVCAKHKDVGIDFDCRNADCGICAIRILSGAENLSKKTVREQDFLTAMRADPDERLSCQVRIFENVDIEIDYL